jgi:hypothetical protein
MMTTSKALQLLVCSSLLLTACDKPATTQPATAPTVVTTAQPNVQWIDPKPIQPGPSWHDALTPAQLDRIRELQTVFSEVDGQTFEQRVEGFKHDLNIDRELSIWGVMAKAYSSYCAKHSLTPAGKKEVFQVVLLRSMASEEDVLSRLELTVITKADAIEIMRGEKDGVTTD